jgi:hypothetical protein
MVNIVILVSSMLLLLPSMRLRTTTTATDTTIRRLLISELLPKMVLLTRYSIRIAMGRSGFYVYCGIVSDIERYVR